MQALDDLGTGGAQAEQEPPGDRLDIVIAVWATATGDAGAELQDARTE